mgnify:FL=1
MNIEKLEKDVQKILDDAETKMFDLIEKYNESLGDEVDLPEVDTVDLYMKFKELKDYVADYGE